MGYSLYRTPRDEGFRANTSGWRWLRAEAIRHGWEPAGTTGPRGWSGQEEWPGDYGANDGQGVKAADARAWAAALDRPEVMAEAEAVSARWAGLVREFIAYCRLGGFRIR